VATDFNDNDMKTALSAWRKSAEKQAERPEWFWARQRARIQSGLQNSNTRGLPAFAWAGMAATLAIGAALLIPGHTNPGQKIADNITDQKAAVAEVSDHELMLSLEDTMNNGVPDSLAPASTLADEMDQAYQGRVQGKENRR
jgi:hypothetical protein